MLEEIAETDNFASHPGFPVSKALLDSGILLVHIKTII